MKEALIKLSEDGGVIDGYRDETRRSAEQDRKIHFPEAESGYDEDIEALKEWIRKRTDWVDENFTLVDDLIHKVDFIVVLHTFSVGSFIKSATLTFRHLAICAKVSKLG